MNEIPKGLRDQLDSVVVTIYSEKFRSRLPDGSEAMDGVRIMAEPDETVRDLIESYCEYNKYINPNGAALRYGKYILDKNWTVKQLGLKSGTVLNIFPDPEEREEFYLKYPHSATHINDQSRNSGKYIVGQAKKKRWPWSKN